MIYTKTYSNGLTLLAESMPYLKSCAFSLEMPAGVGFESPSRRGVASFCCEMALRGCGRWDSRQFIEELLLRGVERGEKVGIGYVSYLAAFPAIYLHDVLEIYAALAQEAHFDEESLEPSRQSVILERVGIEDNPALVARLAAQKDFFPSPWNEHSYGDIDVLHSATLEELTSFYKKYYRPDGTILSVAGAFDWNELQDEVEALFGSWKSQGSLTIQSKAPTRQNRHIDYDAQQTQIVVAYDGVPYSHPDFYRQMVGTSVLGGEASGRLFTQLRERQGLCYSVSAYNFMYPTCAAVFCSLGTSSENAEVALDGLLSEIQNLSAEGVTQEELNRVKTRERTSLIMEQESCGARAVSIASDWINLGKIRTLDEHLAMIESLSIEDVNRYLAENSPRDFQITTLGGEAINNS